MDSDKAKKGDPPATSAHGKNTVHKAHNTKATKLNKAKLSSLAKDKDPVISTMRMLHTTNLY